MHLDPYSPLFCSRNYKFVIYVGLYSVAIYGGLILFGAFLLYDTQKIIYKAERHPVGYGAPPFDPVNASIGIYLGKD
jgi:hypothetical protein